MDVRVQPGVLIGERGGKWGRRINPQKYPRPLEGMTYFHWTLGQSRNHVSPGFISKGDQDHVFSYSDFKTHKSTPAQVYV
jgi:hypothetical protein